MYFELILNYTRPKVISVDKNYTILHDVYLHDPHFFITTHIIIKFNITVIVSYGCCLMITVTNKLESLEKQFYNKLLMNSSLVGIDFIFNSIHNTF